MDVGPSRRGLTTRSRAGPRPRDLAVTAYRYLDEVIAVAWHMTNAPPG